MTSWCRCFISALISFLDILSFSKSLIGCWWIAPMTPDVIMMRGLICQPAVWIVCMRWVVFSGLSIVCGVWEYVVPIQWIVWHLVRLASGGGDGGVGYLWECLVHIVCPVYVSMITNFVNMDSKSTTSTDHKTTHWLGTRSKSTWPP